LPPQDLTHEVETGAEEDHCYKHKYLNSFNSSDYQFSTAAESKTQHKKDCREDDTAKTIDQPKRYCG